MNDLEVTAQDLHTFLDGLGVLDAFLDNCQNKSPYYYVCDKEVSLMAFGWLCSPEGFDFWYSIDSAWFYLINEHND